MRGIAFVTGGLDSTLVVLKLLRQKHAVIPFFIRYNQWQQEEEEKAVKNLLPWIRSNFAYTGTLEDLRTLDVPFPNKVGHSAFRPLAFLGLAGMIMENEKECIDFIAAGYHNVDSEYPEATAPWQDEVALLIGKQYGVKYLNPLGGLNKRQIGKELTNILDYSGVPWSMLYTCFWSPPCGSKSDDDTYRCKGCRGKSEAMIGAESIKRKPVIGRPLNAVPDIGRPNVKS